MTDILSAQRRARYAVERIVGAQDADDVLQNAAVKALRHAHGFAGSSKYETWFYRIAINEALMHKRKRQSVTGIEFDAMMSAAISPETLAMRAERDERLWRAVESLPCKMQMSALAALNEEQCIGTRDKARRFKMRRKLREVLSVRASL